ncbi:MAG: hypothetical protein V7K77_01215 [Nostoc sp.]
MSEELNKKSKPECPVPKELREKVKDAAEIVDKHKQVAKKLNPFN